MKVLIAKDKRKYYWKSGDLHTDRGLIRESDIKKKKITVSNKGEEFIVLSGGFKDTKLKRGPAVILNKDIGLILLDTNIDKNSRVLEAGSGSGFLTVNLARFVKEVVSYDNKDESLRIARENVKTLELDNVKLKKGDVYADKIKGKFDLVVLDLSEPWKALENCSRVLSNGKYLVCYLPNITQVIELVGKANDFMVEKVCEVLVREWHVEEMRVRPKNIMLGHTAFLVFMRKI